MLVASQKSHTDSRSTSLGIWSQGYGIASFGKRGKLSPRYIEPFKILARVGPMLNVGTTGRVERDSYREVKRLKQSQIPIIKVRWNSRRGPEFTWEREDQFKNKHPHLFAEKEGTDKSN
ncbi:hypothetical protein Tco_0858739 [Tanacetum coccineum]|uniref:Reverse transcriptase domain-containing protein n=1 Tax=Tanacetum coccineum TaxID=301880 RepID=A0ABQ5BDA8_9ASTR